MSLTDEEVLAIANRPSTPVFTFGSPELAEWNKQQRGGYSGWYVVLHLTPHIPNSPSFRVLSCWYYGNGVPLSIDVPQSIKAAA
ncbi:hypothetical protein [Pseudomonas aeruginosa]|uniref:hypothetical protein n=1 Tax=Pseudomonas aeruginosa TaxID=287 RepID=UPI0034E06FEA